MPHLNLSKKVVDALPFSKGAPIFYRDRRLAGFAVRCGKTSKSYIAEARVLGRNTRIVLGLVTRLTPQQARKNGTREAAPDGRQSSSLMQKSWNSIYMVLS